MCLNERALDGGVVFSLFTRCYYRCAGEAEERPILIFAAPIQWIRPIA